MLPTSTFAGNSLAAAAVVADGEMGRLELPTRVVEIAKCVRESLGPLVPSGVELAVAAHLWVLEMPEGFDHAASAGRKCTSKAWQSAAPAVSFACCPRRPLFPRTAQACGILRGAVLRQLVERNA